MRPANAVPAGTITSIQCERWKKKFGQCPTVVLHLSRNPEDELRTSTLLAVMAALAVGCSSNPPPTALIPTTVTPVPTQVVPSPTVTSVPTAAFVPPSPTLPMSTPIPVPTLAPATAQASTCDNPFHPVKPDASWNYQISYGSTSTAVTPYTMTLTNITPTGFSEHRVFADGNVNTDWVCSPDGLLATQLVDLAATSGSQFVSETLDSRGITIPPANQWNVGATWTNHYSVKGQFKNNNNPINGQGDIDTQNRITGQEQVTVPAGTFDTYRVESATTMNLTASLGFIGVPTTMNVSEVSWYARDVGLVKSELTFQSTTATTDLVSFTP